MQNIINFLKYHNLVPIILGVVLIGTAGAFANEDVRNTVIGERTVNEEGIDNSLILAADLGNFNFNFQIADIAEDQENYYVNYAYQTLAIKDNIWQPVFKGDTMKVSKEELAGKDLGLYAQGEIGEVADYELKYLKEVQAMERKKGMTELTASVNYTGLIGLVLDVRNKIFPNYEPIVEQPAPAKTTTYYSTSTAEMPGNPISPTSENQEIGFPDIESVCRNGENRPCSSEVGACRIGVQICEQGVWGECIGAVFPTEEICDGVDNNCNGQVDEGDICSPSTTDSSL